MQRLHALRRVVVWVALVLVGTMPAWADKADTMPAPAAYVDDYAGVLSQPAKGELEALCREVHTKTRAQVFLVTVKTLDGEPMDTFANRLFHTWKIGEKKTDRGVLLVLDIAEHKRRIEVGYGLEGVLNDAKVGDFGREMVPALKASDYDEAARIGVRDVSRAIAGDAGVELASLDGLKRPAVPVAKVPAAQPQAPGVGVAWTALLLVLLPVGLFFMMLSVIVRNARRGFLGAGGGYIPPMMGGSGFSDPGSAEPRIGGDSSGGDMGGSGFGGGGGDSGGGFSGGDGGDSGGGGAGGSW